MKLNKIAATLVVLQTVAGHTVFTTLFVDDVNQGDGTCVRMPMNPPTATNPLINLASNDMACGVDGTKGVQRVCSVSQSSKLSFLFRTWPDASQSGSLDPSHKGPCAVYMKAVDSAIKDTATGNGWFKIWDEGYDSKTSQWCTEKLIDNNGFLSVKVPTNLAGGYYLVRPELLSLHEADKNPPQPQFYANCAQIFLKSKATTLPKNTVSIPGYVTKNEPSVLFNIYIPKFPYTTSGPAVFSAGSETVQTKAVETQTEGLLPGNVVLTNANWWGIEVPGYVSQEQCNASAESCWAQANTCYDSAPPTGSKNCNIWEFKCNAINEDCKSGTPRGPPDAGKILTPPFPKSAKIPDVENPDTPVRGGIKQPQGNNLSPAEPKSTTSPDVLVSTLSTVRTYTSIAVSSAFPAAPKASLLTSIDARCGESTGQTCEGSEFGSCCSTNGWCGSSKAYCNSANCQNGFGKCGNETAAGKIKRDRF